MNAAIEQAEEIRERILASAEERFRQYGYGKTTMAEIAKDCGMSAANLYRYFESKVDIAKVLTRRFMMKKEARLRTIAAREDTPADRRLEAFMLEILHHVQQLWAEHPRINELVDGILTESPALLRQHMEVQTGILADLLIQGRAAGLFDVPDPQRTAAVIFAGGKLFSTPSCMCMYTLEEFESLARDLVGLFLRGLLVR